VWPAVPASTAQEHALAQQMCAARAATYGAVTRSGPGEPALTTPSGELVLKRLGLGDGHAVGKLQPVPGQQGLVSRAHPGPGSPVASPSNV
jgi:hypothetical protein